MAALTSSSEMGESKVMSVSALDCASRCATLDLIDCRVGLKEHWDSPKVEKWSAQMLTTSGIGRRSVRRCEEGRNLVS